MPDVHVDSVVRPRQNICGMFETAWLLGTTLFAIGWEFSECSCMSWCVKQCVEKRRIIQFTANPTPPFVLRRSCRSKNSSWYRGYWSGNRRNFGERHFTGTIKVVLLSSLTIDDPSSKGGSEWSMASWPTPLCGRLDETGPALGRAGESCGLACRCTEALQRPDRIPAVSDGCTSRISAIAHLSVRTDLSHLQQFFILICKSFLVASIVSNDESVPVGNSSVCIATPAYIKHSHLYR